VISMSFNLFCFENGSFGKMIKRDEPCDFYDFVVFGRWSAHVYSTALICDLSLYIVEAL